MFEVDYNAKRPKETWELTHILVPMHPKIRISFAGIRSVAQQIVIDCAKELKKGITPFSFEDFPKLIFQTRIQRAVEYVEELIYDPGSIPVERIEEFVAGVSLSRYVGVVRIRSELFGEFDLLIDTTSTLHNIHYLCAIFKGPAKTYTREIADWLSVEAKCPTIQTTQ